tara:strand:+ start:763 stop:975 length:213 start_codon:yes stop_codon:yes gene_type:complete
MKSDTDYKLLKGRLYTQRDWDRTVGMGKVPYEYSLERESDDADMGENAEVDSGRIETRQSNPKGVSKTND